METASAVATASAVDSVPQAEDEMPLGARRSRSRWAVKLGPAAAIIFVALIVLAVGVYCGAGSYNNVWHLALRHPRIQLPRWVPIGIDGSLLAAVLADIVATWLKHPVWFLRYVARIFASGTIAANMIAGWPDPVAVFIDCFPPVVIMTIVEAVRYILLRKHKQARRAAGRGDPIPLARWVLAFPSTFMLKRRMALWGEESFTRAVMVEVRRRQAIAKLQEHYEITGRWARRAWKKHVPSDLVWLLSTGNLIEDACARVEKITAPDEGLDGSGQQAADGSAAGSRNQARRGSRNQPGTGSGTRREPRTGATPEPAAGTGSGNRAMSDVELLTEARRIVAARRADRGKDPSAAELAVALGKRKTVALDLLRTIRSERPGAEAEAR